MNEQPESNQVASQDDEPRAAYLDALQKTVEGAADAPTRDALRELVIAMDYPDVLNDLKTVGRMLALSPAVSARDERRDTAIAAYRIFADAWLSWYESVQATQEFDTLRNGDGRHLFASRV